MIDAQKLLEEGRLLDDRYRLVRPLSTDGGTADVWLAVDVNTIDNPELTGDSDEQAMQQEESGMLVAIKIYRPKNALDIEGEQRFRDEYKIVHNCRHTNLLQPTNFSICDETPYLELPYCKNGSSELLVGKLKNPDEIWKFIYDVASGLAYLHSCDPPIIHQDIKPANVLIDDYQNYAITDFGISASSGGKHNYYYDSEHSGTMAYMAPERFDENYVPSVESDVWALGATLYEILAGTVPFGEEGGRKQLQEGSALPTMPQDISKDIQKLVLSCLSLSPSSRPTTRAIIRIAQSHLQAAHGLIWKLSVAAALVAAAVITVLFVLPGHQTPTPSLETRFKEAIFLLDSDNPEDVRSGLKMMDNLSYENYAPAMYELARTYGWYSDSVSLKRKEYLGIEYFSEGKSRYMPVSNEYNDKARELFTKIVDLPDSGNFIIKANAAYRLSSYYVNENGVYKNDYSKALTYLRMAEYYALEINDTSLLRKTRSGIEQLEKFVENNDNQ